MKPPSNSQSTFYSNSQLNRMEWYWLFQLMNMLHWLSEEWDWRLPTMADGANYLLMMRFPLHVLEIRRKQILIALIRWDCICHRQWGWLLIYSETPLHFLVDPLSSCSVYQLIYCIWLSLSTEDRWTMKSSGSWTLKAAEAVSMSTSIVYSNYYWPSTSMISLELTHSSDCMMNTSMSVSECRPSEQMRLWT